MHAYVDDRPAGFYATRRMGQLALRNAWWTPALLVLPLTLLAWHNRFIQDDAYISFVYARNLINGQGLAWITGDLVEGYTNFLWVLLISAASWLGIDPVDASYGLGLSFFVATLAFTYKLSGLVFGSRQWHGLLVLLLLGTNYTFSAYATGGLETQLQTTLFVVAGYLTVRLIEGATWRSGPLIGLSLIFAAALLTRLDSAICVVVFGVAAVVSLFRERAPIASKVARTSALCLPAIFVLGAWLLWKISYYGSVLPNTYYVKVSSGTSLMRGLIYLWLFAFSYWMTPFVIIWLCRMKDFVSRAAVGLWLSLVLVSLWCLYVLKVGGDFMEFRLLVPILPFLMILVVWLMFECVRQRELRVALVITLLLASANHAKTFETTWEIGSIRELSGYMADPAPGWPAVGRTLARLFPKEKGRVTLAATPVGAIPYYSSLPTIDMHGLNDVWVARNGIINGSVPGHQRLATLDYLLLRGTNLVIGHPLVTPLGAAHKWRYGLEDLKAFRIPMEGVSPQIVPENTRVIEIPIGFGSKIDVLYLVQSAVVDAVIEAEALKTYPVVAR